MKLDHSDNGKATLTILQPDFTEAARRFSRLAFWLAATAVISACTTTQHVTQTQPVFKNSAPSSLSELRIADSALAAGNFEVATSLYDKIVAADPRSIEALTGLGNTLYAVGDFTRAGVYYERARQVDPHAIRPMVGIGRVDIHQRRLDEAIIMYRSVLAVTPADTMASAGLGTALDLKGDHAAAQAVLKQALEGNPGDPMLSVDLGLSLILGGNPREGANVLLDVTRYPAAPPEARQNLALAYGLLGNSEAAAEILSHDLPKASVQDNLRFYEYERARLLHTDVASTPPSAIAKTVGAESNDSSADTPPPVVSR